MESGRERERGLMFAVAKLLRGVGMRWVGIKIPEFGAAERG